MIHLNIKENKTNIEITVKPAGIFFKTVLFILATAPIAALILVLIMSEKIESPFGFFIGLLFFGGCSAFLFRLLLWNSYGKETYSISDIEFTAINDYGWFKDNKRTISSFSSLEIKYAHMERQDELFELTETSLLNQKKKTEFVIVYLIDETPVTSVIKLTTADLTILAKEASKINRSIPVTAPYTA